MHRTGQLLQEVSRHTNVEGVYFDWVSAWTAVVSSTTVSLPEPVDSLSKLVLQRFESVFADVLHERFLRFEYPTEADLLVESTNVSPAPTGVWIDVVPLLPSSEAERDHLTRLALLMDELIDWLGATYDELAKISGASRSALFYWRKGNVTPRAGTTRQLMRVHSVVSLLVKRFGVDGARKWLHSDGSEAWQMLVRGEVDGVERRVRARLFGQPTPPGHGEREITPNVDLPLPPPAAQRTRRARRNPKKGRLATGD